LPRRRPSRHARANAGAYGVDTKGSDCLVIEMVCLWPRGDIRKLMTQANPQGPKELAYLQVLRAYAALLVAVGHATLAAHGAELGAPSVGVLRDDVPLWGFGFGFGVDVFFVISGCIMAYVGGRNFGVRGAAGDFLARRIIRIAPLYWLSTLAVVGVGMVTPGSLNGAPPGGLEVATSLLFIPALDTSGAILPVLPVGWSLNYEMFFYLVFSICMCLPRRFGLLALAGVLGLCVLLGVVFQPESPPLKTWTNPLSLEFLFGVAIAVATMAGLTLRGWALALLGLAAVLTSSLTVFLDIQLETPRILADGAPAALLVLLAVTLPEPRPGVVMRGLTLLGNASYSLYLTHLFTVRIVLKIWQAIGLHDLPAWLFTGVATLAAISTALLCYLLVERPMTEWLKGRYAVIKSRLATRRLASKHARAD